MTTYPLSEPATIYGDEGGAEVLGKGTLAECADIVRGLSDEARSSAAIKMDDLPLTYGPAEVSELVHFLRNEDEGLSDRDIADIAGSIE
ncbi:hypothetical protein [Sphingomonas phyllosphaerae]|uniref:hypothetical protein n=1 Tax=Sphingomonas phyllosphaerae TaxID=257003 RepID=UPI000491DDE7|nr:hypothetical protein [Sphingomonas phyllosphaerae]